MVDGGTGQRFGRAVIILAGFAALAATLVTFLSIWLQTKNYRKPLLQRYVVRILLMVPIYSAASWASLESRLAAAYVDPFRDVYEAFTIYAFFQLLINFLGGERSLIIMMHGRPPVSHPWPVSRCLPKVDISDPHTFLAMKRGILQYTWIKPLLAIATVAMKATGTFQEGVLSPTSGYLWSGLIYNVSITVSLYALAMFWLCMAADLRPFRPMPKFLCIKGIIFASYWQGFFLSILVALGAIPDDVSGYSPDGLAASIQDALICFEMPAFALLHWYAFSWKDYADETISAARMPVKFALRDAFGILDLVQDAKETLAGSKYEYRYFDAGDDVLAHEESGQRVARMMEGMRYARGDKRKYWVPMPGEANSKTPLLAGDNRDMVTSSNTYGSASNADIPEPTLDSDEEHFYTNARALEFGDFNYPVILAHHATREDRLYQDPRIVTSSTNRNLIQPTQDYRRRRKTEIKHIQEDAKGKRRGSSSSAGGQHRSSAIPPASNLHRQHSHSSAKSDSSQLVDLVVEDEGQEAAERARARKEGSPEWNRHDPKHFVRAFPDDDQAEEVVEGYEATEPVNKEPQQLHTVDTSVTRSDHNEQDEQRWHTRDYSEEVQAEVHDRGVAPDIDEPNVWASPTNK